MGGGESAPPEDCAAAYRLGQLIAEEGWVLLNGGRPAGIMEASAKGAKDRGGLTIGILPGNSARHASKYIDIPVVTGMGDARNVINVLTSDAVVALPGKGGTISEVALALKNGKKVVLLNFDPGKIFETYRESGLLRNAGSPEEAVKIIRNEFCFGDRGGRPAEVVKK
ncbi:MAG: TIGR00725 family protein [Pelotomaculum sp.]|nr:TIGR00725 family protein [Pelotomaculum sp.]